MVGTAARASRRPTPLSWFTTSELFSDPTLILKPVWASPRTTKLYDRRAQTASLDEVERIIL